MAMRRQAVTERASPSVLMAVEQLRRRVPGGIGVYTRGLLGGLAQIATEGDEVEVALLARATVLAYPSLYEGFGFPPLQAMQAGVPVVATRAGSLPEVLGDAAALVEPGDHDGLVDALSRCLGDEEERGRLIAAGTEWSARYSWDRCGEGLETLYRDAAADRG